MCGDSLLQPSLGEQCDEGGQNSNAGACTLTCKNAVCGDNLIQENVEQCDDGVNNGAGKACNAMCKVNVCGDDLNNNDGCSAMCKAEFCFQFTNTAAEDIVNNNWFDACVAAPGNNVAITLYDVNNVIVYQASGPKVGMWTQSQLTSTAGLNDRYHSVNHNRIITLNNGDKLMIAGKDAANAGCGGSFGNGYGIVVYPNAPNYYFNPKMLVMPYKQYVAPWQQVRLFTPWSTSNEISWNGGTPMNTCNGPNPGFLGKVQFRVF